MITKDQHLLNMALWQARYSRDPNTKVGAILVSTRGHQVGACNHLPKGCFDNPLEILEDRPRKLQAIVHAEMAAICEAARGGVPTEDATLYIACTDDTRNVWGGCPCTNCAKHVVNAGIKRVVTYERKTGFSKWHEELELAEGWLKNAGIEVTYVPYQE